MICIVVQPDGTLSQGSFDPESLALESESETCPYVLVTKNEAQSFVSGAQVVEELQQLASAYFDFDPEAFSYLQAWILASFIAAFGAARLVSWMKT